MNRYGLLAQEMWTKHAPTFLETLDSPQEYFEILGESAEEQIELTRQRLEQSVASDLPYLERVGQLNAVRKQAEEMVLQDLIYSPLSTMASPVDPTTQLEDRLAKLPSAAAVEDELMRIQDLGERQAEDEGLPEGEVLLLPDQMEMRDQLLELLPLLRMDPESMSDQETKAALATLQMITINE